MSAAFLSRTSTDGIVTVRASVGGPPTASLLIDTDPARDTPADAGLTLLAMKVLLLATGLDGCEDSGASEDRAALTVTGSTAELASGLQLIIDAATALGDVDDRTVDRAREALLAEKGELLVAGSHDVLSARFGLAGSGTSAVAPWRLHTWSSHDVRRWARTHLHADAVAVLLLDTDLPLLGLAPLRGTPPAAGESAHPAPQPSAPGLGPGPHLLTTSGPAHRWSEAQIVWTALHQASASPAVGRVTRAVLAAAITDSGRRRHGLEITAVPFGARAEAADLAQVHISAETTALPAAADAVATAVRDVCSAVWDERILARAVAASGSIFALRTERLSDIAATVLEMLRGRPDPVPSDEELDAVTEDEVRTELSAMAGSTIVGIRVEDDPSAEAADALLAAGYRRLEPFPARTPPGSPGTTLRGSRLRRSYGTSVTIVGEVLAFDSDGDRRDLDLSDAVLVRRWSHGVWSIATRAGGVLDIDARLIRGLDRALRRQVEALGLEVDHTPAP